MLRFFYMTGLRLHELAAATFGMVQTDAGADGAPAYTLSFRGKGGRARSLPLAPAALQALQVYINVRGLGVDPAAAALASVPLVTRLRAGDSHWTPGAALGAGRIYTLISATLKRAAEAIEAEGDARAAQRLRLASTHWLRHSFATRCLQQLPMRHVQLLLGHDDIATTGEYIDVDEEALRAGVQQVFGQA